MAGDNEVARQLAEKLRLEAKFAPTVRSLLNQAAAEAGRGYRQSGVVPAIGAAFLADWRVALQDHYLGVGRRFQSVAMLPPDADADQFRAESNIEFARFVRRQALTQARTIAETNQDEAETAFSAAAAEIMAETGNVGGVALAAIASLGQRRLTQAYLARVGTIALTETQAPAEARKLIDVRTATRIPPSRPSPAIPVVAPVAVKTWRTVGDGKVRDAHSAANGQTVDADGFFTVGGEKLEYPGDRWSGASLKNVINCRCTALYSVR